MFAYPFVCPSMSFSVSLALSLSLSLSLFLSLSPPTSLSIPLSLSLPPALALYVCLSLRPSVCSSVSRPSVLPSVRASVACLFIYPNLPTCQCLPIALCSSIESLARRHRTSPEKYQIIYNQINEAIVTTRNSKRKLCCRTPQQVELHEYNSNDDNSMNCLKANVAVVDSNLYMAGVMARPV